MTKTESETLILESKQQLITIIERKKQYSLAKKIKKVIKCITSNTLCPNVNLIVLRLKLLI